MRFIRYGISKGGKTIIKRTYTGDTSNIPAGYNSFCGYIFADYEGKTIGYSCYGEIPCTTKSFDLYWIAVHNDFRDKGIGKKIFDETYNAIKKQNGRKIYIVAKKEDSKKLVGRQGKNVNQLSKLLKKDIQIVKDEEERKMIENILSVPIIAINIIYSSEEIRKIRI